MLCEDTKILEFILVSSQSIKILRKPLFCILFYVIQVRFLKFDKKFYKASFMFNKKNYLCKRIPENSFTIKIGEHIPSGFSISTILLSKSTEIKHDAYRVKGCMKKFCESLREHKMEMIKFFKKIY